MSNYTVNAMTANTQTIAAVGTVTATPAPVLSPLLFSSDSACESLLLLSSPSPVGSACGLPVCVSPFSLLLTGARLYPCPPPPPPPTSTSIGADVFGSGLPPRRTVSVGVAVTVTVLPSASGLGEPSEPPEPVLPHLPLLKQTSPFSQNEPEPVLQQILPAGIQISSHSIASSVQPVGGPAHSAPLRQHPCSMQ